MLGVGVGFGAAYALHHWGGGIGQITGRQSNPGIMGSRKQGARPSRVPPAISGILSSLARAGYRVWEARVGDGVKYFAQEILGGGEAFEVEQPQDDVIDITQDGYEGNF